MDTNGDYGILPLNNPARALREPLVTTSHVPDSIADCTAAHMVAPLPVMWSWRLQQKMRSSLAEQLPVGITDTSIDRVQS